MITLNVSGPSLVLDEADAELVLRCVDLFCREAAKVAGAPPRRATLFRADVGRFLALVAEERDRAATIAGVMAASGPMMVRQGVAPAPPLDFLSTSQAAEALGTSDSFIRRYAAERWGATKVGGHWRIPRSAVLTHLRKQRRHGEQP